MGLLAPGAAQAAGGQVFKVTSASLCGDAGTFEQAVKEANANPGKDTIEFAPGLSVDVSVCATLHAGVDEFPIKATESVDIIGNGTKVVGNQFWVNENGHVNDINSCPSVLGPDAHWMSLSKGFLAVGEYGKDNSGVQVGLRGLSFDNLPELFAAYEHSSLTVSDVQAININSFNGNCGRPAIEAFTGADVTLRDVQISESAAPGIGRTEFDIKGLVTGFGGDLVMDRVFLADNLQGRAVGWGYYGANKASVKIVSSKIVNSGGLRLGATQSDVVNTIYYTRWQTPADRVVASEGATRIEASSFYWNEPKCTPNCPNIGMGFWIPATGTIDFKSTAVGGWATLNGSGPLLFGNTAGFSSDATTWVQQTANQPNADLQAILPNVLTTYPGLTPEPKSNWWLDSVTPMLGTPLKPGVLLDVIPDAACPAGANALLNPVDGSCILEDALGNPRWDSGNHKRNIGAVQNVQAPHLAVDIGAQVAPTEIALLWNRPPDLSSGPITGYNVYYAPVAGGAQQTYYIPGADTLRAVIPGLTPGTEYKFTVAAVNKAGAGALSNEVRATPLGPPTKLAVSTRPGNEQITLAWTEPDFNGSTGPALYYVVWRKKGETAWNTGPSLSARITTIPGLVNGTEYEFGVTATTLDQSASTPLSTAYGTPRAASFVPIDPERAYDSRTAGAGGPIAGGQARTVSVAGQVPEKAVAVAYNLTVTGMTRTGYLTVTPGGTATEPLSSTINWSGPGQLLANGIVVGVDAKREIKVFAGGSGSTQFVVDVVGYYLPFADDPSNDPSMFTPLAPVRAYDSRVPDGGNPSGPLAGGSSRAIDLTTNTAGALPDGITAIAYNLTVTGMTKTGYLAVAPGNVGTAPNVSTINWWTTNQVLANGIEVKIDPNKTVNVFAGGTGQTQFVIDIVGYYAPLSKVLQGAGFSPIEPVRSYDSRTTDGPIAAGQQRSIDVASGDKVPTTAKAIAYNLTETGNAGTGYLTVFPGNIANPPSASTINWYRPQLTMANGTTVGISPARTMNVYAGGINPTASRTQFVVDTVGYFN